MPREIAPADLRLADWIGPDDAVVFGQLTAEPMTLTEALNDQSPSLSGVRAFVGMSVEPILTPSATEHLRLSFAGGAATNHRLAPEGRLDALPVHLSRIPHHLEAGDIPCDVALIHAAPDGSGGFNLGLSADYMGEAVEAAGTVIAEINEALPQTFGDTGVAASAIDVAVPVNRPPPVLPRAEIGGVEKAIGEHVARLIPDRATVQLGIGAIPDAVMEALAGKKDLGIHSGLIGDRVMDLVEAGVVTNRYKEVGEGLTTTAILYGTEDLYRWAHRNERLSVRSVAHTHDPGVLLRFGRFFAVNSAVEVDLTGQINGEVAGGRPVGLVGGQVDFSRAGLWSPEGRGIIALRSTARKGAQSTIVRRLSEGVVTTPRTDADIIVTEFGMAELAGVPIQERARRLIAIAHPDFRAELAKAAERLF